MFSILALFLEGDKGHIETQADSLPRHMDETGPQPIDPPIFLLPFRRAIIVRQHRAGSWSKHDASVWIRDWWHETSVFSYAWRFTL